MRMTKPILWLLCLCTAMPLCMNVSEIHATTTRTRIAVGKSFVNDTIIKPSGLTGSIDKLTMSGVVRKLSPNFSVRVVLKTTTGQEYLLMELYDALCSTQSRTFSNYAEETELLNHVTPDSLKIYVRNARLTLTSLYKTVMTGNDYPSAEDPDSLLRRRIQIKVDTINAINQRTNKLWRAGVTELSLQNDTMKRQVLSLDGGEVSNGLEFYVGGIFEYGAGEYAQPAPSPYISEFDWRNRHGKNWMTSVKSQLGSRFCVAFGTLGALEALVNLYYNNETIDVDLSEQQIACCQSDVSIQTAYSSGMWPNTALKYIKQNGGVYDEAAYPFVRRDQNPVMACMSDSITPNEVISFSDYHNVPICEDSLKKYLMCKGPLVGKYPGHLMTLVGFGTLQAGDTIAIVNSNNYTGVTPDTIVIREGDSRIGQTYWKFKNSVGLEPYVGWNEHNNGYLYMLYTNIGYMDNCYYIDTPIQSLTRTEHDIICEDTDGDGYYFWGIGSKPAHCPANVPEEPDGDDSNPLYGPMNEYGYLESLNPNDRDTIYITTSTISSQKQHFYNHVVLCNGATWDIQDNVTFHNGAKLIVRENAQLSVKANGVLRGANVISKSSSQVKVEEGGQIIRPTNGEFKVELGSTFELDEGSVQ